MYLGGRVEKGERRKGEGKSELREERERTPTARSGKTVKCDTRAMKIELLVGIIRTHVAKIVKSSTLFICNLR